MGAPSSDVPSVWLCLAGTLWPTQSQMPGTVEDTPGQDDWRFWSGSAGAGDCSWLRCGRRKM